MKERPIIFTELIPKILDGTKTNTRRVITHPAVPNSDMVSFQEFLNVPPPTIRWEPKEGYYALLRCNATQNFATIYFKCPYGQVGDRLWVRETHYRYGKWIKNGLTKTGRQRWCFKAFTDTIYYTDNPPSGVKPNSYRQEGWYKRPAIFMPRTASRITREITGIRVERVQEITDSDCEAEGISKDVYCYIRNIGKATEERTFSIRRAFHWLWDSLNAKYPWESNPWVWVIEFKRIDKT